MKGVILHGGAGTRLRPLTFSGPKQLIEVAGKPVSQWVLEDLVSAGVREVAIVLGDVYPELVVQHYGDGSRFGARVTYVHQGRPLGIAHAVSLCREFVGGDSFVVYLGVERGLVRAVPMSSVRFVARRPWDSSLDTSRAAALGLALPPLKVCLEHFIRSYREALGRAYAVHL